ncbi:Gfo/Idh/MocA family oxidoreductase [Hungatella hathewayi]|uniref:Gfo/Idh/MocA family protein n=1 Tax=Hungatella hathewayi TaxID=154046 RepID=UPI000339369F|nr:Gfo/Idh/MocA family oxidoreductase [Hungatella hathewayi]CCZ62998.1 oxidoreductase domain protein [Hungatella hathewayi CAG:224]
MIKAGLVGCGMIAHTYLNNIIHFFREVHVVACSDAAPDRAKTFSEEFAIERVVTLQEMLEDEEIELILNLTVPAAHYEISRQALLAGKHVYSEKPMALTMAEASELRRISEEKGLCYGCAPDTFLGAALQTCKKLIDDGWIGRPVAATANMVSHGNETWHPSPDFFYQKGGGPMMDMGPYYVTALVSLLGPVDSTACFASAAWQKRRIYSQPDAGREMTVEVPTHYSGLLRFAQGTLVTMNMSFDIWLSSLPKLEIYGTEGTLILPDPNRFSGEVKVLRAESMIDEIDGLSNQEAMGRLSKPEMWGKCKSMPLLYRQPAPDMRGIGLSQMVRAIKHKEVCPLNARLSEHVTEVLLSFDGMGGDEIYHMTTSCDSYRLKL